MLKLKNPRTGKYIYVDEKEGRIFNSKKEYDERNKKCKKYEHFDADGFLQYEDAYCLNCLKEDCENKPNTDNLKKTENAINELVDEFIEKYEFYEYEWIDSIGANLDVDQYYCFHFSDVLDAMRLNPTKEQLTNWYEQWVCPSEKHPRYNLEHWILIDKNNDK